MNGGVKQTWSIVREVGYPTDFRGDEIAIGYVKEEYPRAGIKYKYLPIYFYNGDWQISLGHKNDHQTLIAYSRAEAFDNCQFVQKESSILLPFRARKIQCYDESKDIWCYYDGKNRNPCGCGSNCYHYEYDGEKIYGVCNACKADIYEMKPEYVEEKLKQGVWI